MTDIHILAPFHLAGGGQWQAIDLYLTLREAHNVTLWSPRVPHKDFINAYPIREIKPYRGELPNAGVLIVGGALTDVGHWYDHMAFQKVIVIHNEFAPDILYKGLHRLTLNGKRNVEVVYVSNMLQDAIKLPGSVLHPFPHPARFKPALQNKEERPFTVGRISRDVVGKHYYADPDLYRKLSIQEIRVKVIGGTCLQPWLTDTDHIDLLPEIPQLEVPITLSTLDCFYYRTSINIKEAFGLAVVEAMLCELPVVCHRQGGYSELIEHGRNGFLFDSQEEAISIISRLRKNTELRKEIGLNARISAENRQAASLEECGELIQSAGT